MLSVGSRKVLAVRSGVGVENTNIIEGALKASSLETISSDIKPSTILSYC